MNGEIVADIAVDKTDSADEKILSVYAKVTPVYAVYRTRERVVIQFADDPALGAEQRKALAALNPLRGQINGLIDGWRSAENGVGRKRNIFQRVFLFWRTVSREEVASKAKMFDRRVADALVMALQGDPDHALALLAEVKDDLLEERTSAARIDYIAVAAAAAAVLILVSSLLTAPEFFYSCAKGAKTLWLGAGAGALGALFSTAIAMHTRSILTDLQLRENRTDAIVRIGIGAMAGALLVGMVTANIATFSLGGGPIGGGAIGGGVNGWLVMAFIGFVAGFSERLVPGLLDKASAAAAAAAQRSANPIAGSTAVSTASMAASTAARGVASETNPLGKPEAGDADADDDADSSVDGCDVDFAAEEGTDDSQLPAADGGVEEPPVGAVATASGAGSAVPPPPPPSPPPNA